MTTYKVSESETHKQLIAELRKTDPRIKVANFRAECALGLAKHGAAEQWNDYSTEERKEAIKMWRGIIPPFHPDAFSIHDLDTPFPTITLYEVVVSSDIDARKFFDILELWFYTDSANWKLNLIVIDRVGNKTIEVTDEMWTRMYCEYRRARQFVSKVTTVDMNLVYRKFSQWAQELPHWLLPIAEEETGDAFASPAQSYPTQPGYQSGQTTTQEQL